MNPFRLSAAGCELPHGTLSYLVGSKSTSSGAFTLSDPIRPQLGIPGFLGVHEATLICYDEAGCEVLTRPGKWLSSAGATDLYTFDLSGALGVGLYFYTVRIASVYGALYASPSSGGVRFSESPSASMFQLSVSDFAFAPPASLYGGVIYHIFVDRFARGGKAVQKPGTVLVKDWSSGIPEYPEYPGAHLKNNTFYGGTLRGIEQKLPYIASLGVSAIYLSPIFDAASNHKYDTGDYMKVDEMFGGERALRSLLRAARKQGIAVILDGVFNHTGDDSLYFNRYSNYDSTGAYQSEDSPYYSWYDFRSYPDDYTSWWGIEILPRIHPDDPSCSEYFVGSGGVIEKYARMGVSGFRLDVVDELSDAFVAKIKKTLSEANPDSVLYGEVWEDASNKIAYDKRKRYYLGEELDGVMNYPLRTGIIDYLLSRNTEKLRYALTSIIYNAPKRIRDAQMNLLGTHDTERILTVLGGEASEGKTNDYLAAKRMSSSEYECAVKRLKVAYTVLATLPGIPMIFYGDEVGLEGYSDPFNRMPYPWGREDGDLLGHYRLVGRIRRNSPVYGEGEYKLLELTPDVLIFARYGKGVAYVTVVNNADRLLTVTSDGGRIIPLIGNAESVQPYSAEIFKVPSNSSICYKFTT